jgi:hypothetical protein
MPGAGEEFRQSARPFREPENSASVGRPWKSALLAALCILLAGCRAQSDGARPTIEFSKVPQKAEGGPDKLDTIEGRVIGARAGQRIVLFARSGAWWVQPLVDQPFTAIEAGSKWANSTHLGTEYAALLVEPGYHPPATLDALPGEGGAVVAVAKTQGAEASPDAAKTLQFSGYEWKVRGSVSERGGRMNLYDPANAWTDASGFLHLRIARRADQWSCAEVRLTRSLGYGSYRVAVREAANLEPAVVFSMFTWDDLGADQNHREMGVEITRWGDPASKNAQYVIQPYYVPANVARFMAPAGMLTHSIRWEPGRAAFRTVRGLVNDSRAPAVAEHVFTSGVPSPGDESIHLNLYIFGVSGEALQNEAEVVIEKFEYFP